MTPTTRTASATISKLEEIVDRHLSEVDRTRSVAAEREQAMAVGDTRGFEAAIRDDESLSVIAEIKRRSPSQGDLNTDLVPSDLATSYAEGGAACLSVLTDHHYFGGSLRDLVEARQACRMPVLRKDFTVDVLDVYDARRTADAVLLIVGARDSAETRDLFQAAADVQVDALVEVHDESDLEEALTLGATLVGVNQRNLREMRLIEPDQYWAVKMAPHLPDHVVSVAMSGVRSADDARRLRNAGYDAILVGETLVRSPDPAAMVKALRVP